MMPDVLLIEPCNFVDYPTGGQLSFARQLMKAYGDRLALVGTSTDGTPVGRWIEKAFEGKRFMYFSIGHWRPTAKRPLIPGRVGVFIRLRRYRNRIFSLGVHHVFTQSPETMIAISGLRWRSICYCFAGAVSPLHRPRYPWARWLAPVFERRWWKALGRADVLLASADQSSIDEFVRTRRIAWLRPRIVPFPTRYDESVFYPVEPSSARAALHLRQDRIWVMCVGRINVVKGWDLVLEVFKTFLQRHPDAMLCFVGDGEDRQAMLRRAEDIGISESVTVTGFLRPQAVAAYLNAADLVVFGSHHEGWSVAMLEAIACGKPLVSTDVSGSRDMVVEGQNGFIVRQRDPVAFAQAMDDALGLEAVDQVSTTTASRYRLGGLAQDLGRVWSPLAGGTD
jgi:glycosyltransferase involved in cell wall biosynthesis